VRVWMSMWNVMYVYRKRVIFFLFFGFGLGAF